MKIETFILGELQTNCYFIINENTKEAIIIDPAAQADDIMKQLESDNLTPVAILLTHGHFDHIMAVNHLVQEYAIPVYASEEEKELLASSRLNCSIMMGHGYVTEMTQGLQDQDEIVLANIPIKVIHTPGHTIGGTCYYLSKEAVLFSGDTLFYESIGRTDLPTGNSSQLLKSVNEKLMVLPDNIKVYPGHGTATSIGNERRNNPYLSEDSFWN